jgi:hypothetical protein
VRCDRSINTAGNIFFDEMAPKQLGTWVRYINSGLEEGEVNKSVLESVGKFDRNPLVTFWE